MSINFLPNVISFVRLGIAAGIFCATYFSLYSIEWYFYMFVAGYMTDAADGMLARWLCASSSFGAWVDLLADKMLFFSIWTYIAYMSTSWAVVLCIVLLTLREIASIIMREYAARHRLAVPVQSHGKFKTLYVGLVTIFSLLQVPLFPPYVLLCLWVSGVVLSWLSFFKYLRQFMLQSHFNVV